MFALTTMMSQIGKELKLLAPTCTAVVFNMSVWEAAFWENDLMSQLLLGAQKATNLACSRWLGHSRFRRDLSHSQI